jgi:hypothetical protein
VRRLPSSAELSWEEDSNSDSPFRTGPRADGTITPSLCLSGQRARPELEELPDLVMSMTVTVEAEIERPALRSPDRSRSARTPSLPLVRRVQCDPATWRRCRKSVPPTRVGCPHDRGASGPRCRLGHPSFGDRLSREQFVVVLDPDRVHLRSRSRMAHSAAPRQWVPSDR